MNTLQYTPDRDNQYSVSLTRRIWTVAASAIAAATLVLAPAVEGGASAHADYYGPDSNQVGGGETYWVANSLAQVQAKTTCSAAGSKVSTQVIAAPNTQTAGQWFYVKVFARDITGGYGAWKPMQTGQQYVRTTHLYTGSWGVADPYPVLFNQFTGLKGHYYQIYVQAWSAVQGGQYGDYRGLYSHHYSTYGAPSASPYGAATQSMSSAVGYTDYCKVF